MVCAGERRYNELSRREHATWFAPLVARKVTDMDARTPKSSTASASAPPLAALVEMLLLAAQDLRVERPRDEPGQDLRSRVAGGLSRQEDDIAESEPAGGEEAEMDLQAQGSNSPTYLQEVRALPKLSSSTELRLFGIARSADASPAQAGAARRQIIRATLWMVPIIVRRYYRNGGSVFDDLVAEGNMGLYKAFDRFDPARGFRFSTYAKWWVTDAVTAGMAANAYPLRMPRKVALELARQQHSDEPASMQAGSAPLTDDEALQPRSLDPFEGGMQHDGQQQPHPWPEQIVALREALQLLSHAVAGLPKRERTVIEGRYGLNGSAERTLQDIGDELGLTAERVRTLQLSAMSKLRQHVEGTAGQSGDGPDAS
jgi:RNA polymerase sigma factor (sigma-70 family)